MTRAGWVSVTVLAGPIKATDQPPHPEIGQQVTMGDDFYFRISPAIAKQWIGVLETIATKEEK